MDIDFIGAAVALLKRKRAEVQRGVVLTLLSIVGAALNLPALAATLPVISEARVTSHEGVTRIALVVNAPVRYQMFTLDGPPRAVIDLPNVLWMPSALPQPAGLFAGLRHGRFKPGASRIVIECRQAFVIGSSALTASESGGYRLIVDLIAAAPAANRQNGARHVPSRALAGDSAPSRVPNIGGGKITPVVGATGLPIGDIGPPSAATLGTLTVPQGQAAVAGPLFAAVRPTPRPPAAARFAQRWVVAIDPGHGGQDPGAISLGSDYEKRITLAVARALRDELAVLGRYKAVLTRDDDRFVSLRNRIAIARAAGSDIFVSLHADTMPSDAVRGLSVYTLSERASDAEAAALAERENKADLIAGVKLAGETPEVTHILIDLIQRETMNDSARFASLLIEELEQETILLPRTHRFAGFAVLKAPDVPSVLVELGYLSNERDERLLRSGQHRRRLARGIARAIDRYFVRLQARNHH